MPRGDPVNIMSRRDMEFLLFDWLDVDTLTKHERYAKHSHDIFVAVLDLAAQMAEKHFAPHNSVNDRCEPTFDGMTIKVIPEVAAALDTYARSGLLGSSMDERVGGGQLPHVVSRAAFTWLQAANSATAAYPLLTMGTANLLARYGSGEQIDRYVRPMLEGRFFGTMCLSEPDVGSSLADVTARAEPQTDGTYRLFGNKMWISGGEHEMGENIIHLVLARSTTSPKGVRGLSLFVVPRYLVAADGGRGERNDVVAAGINHKTGYRGTVNALLAFGEGRRRPAGQPGAVGYLVGEIDHGLEYMFHMMNEARVAVGGSAVALGYTSYLHAVDYARTRTQGRLPGSKNPLTKPVPIIAHADVRRMLLASKSYVEGGLALVLYAAKLLDDKLVAATAAKSDRLELLLDVLTPIVKAWPSRWCRQANDFAIQVHGGYGYSREFPVEQFWRDNRLNSIHEGTDGIQALDLLGRKVTMRDGAALKVLAAKIRESITRAPEALRYATEPLESLLMRVEDVTAKLWAAQDPLRATASASLYADALGHLVVAWMWLEQMTTAHRRSGPVHIGKLLAGRYFFSYELPTVGPALDLLERNDPILIELDDTYL